MSGKHNLKEWLEDKQTDFEGSGKAFYSRSIGGYMLGWGTTVPSSAADWAPAALFLDLDAGSAEASLHINEGTTSSSDFVPYDASGGVAGATISVAAESSNDIDVTIQLTDGAGNDIDEVAVVELYLSSDDAGKDFEANGVDSWSIKTDGGFEADGTDSVIGGKAVSEADGDIDMTLTHVGADTFYMNVVLPNGKKVTSDAITFDAST